MSIFFNNHAEHDRVVHYRYVVLHLQGSMQDGVVAEDEVISYAHVRARERVERYAVVYPRSLPDDDRGAVICAYRRTLLQPGVCPEPRIADEPRELPDVRP
jgi:hypothetical protein